MPSAVDFPPEVRALLEAPQPAVIACVRDEGQPVSVATWYLMDGDRVLVNMDQGRKRLDYLRADPRVSITVLKADDWYTHVSMQGRVVEMSEDHGLVGIDRLSRHYRGKDYAVRDRGRVNAWIEIDRWHGWGKVSRGG